MLTIFKTTLLEKKQVLSNIYLFTFKLKEPKEINFIPGQYLILKINNKPRLYSISSSNLEKNIIQFIIELVPNGLASTYLKNLQINEEVIFQGPAGQFKLKETNKKKIFFVTGTGIAPVKSILESNHNLINYYVFWGLKTYEDVYITEELKKYNLKICLSRESDLNKIKEEDKNLFSLGHVDSCFFRELNFQKEDINNFEFYLCGGRAVVDSLRQNLLSKNIPIENIIFEKF